MGNREVADRPLTQGRLNVDDLPIVQAEVDGAGRESGSGSNSHINVLVTDPPYVHTLAMVRALGKLGFGVDVVSDRDQPLAAFSKFCRQAHTIPRGPEEGRFGHLNDVLAQGKYDVLIPIGTHSFKMVSENLSDIAPPSKTLVPPMDMLQTAMNKKAVYELSQQLGIRVPKTRYPESLEEVKSLSTELEFPVVVKGLIEAAVNVVDFARSPTDLVTKWDRLRKQHEKSQQGTLPMVQEFIGGDCFGFFALYQKGRCKRVFMHHGLRDYPGFTARATSVFDPRLKELGVRLLDALQWEGVAMVEFKANPKTRDYTLMEINPKFWTSLDLAVESGANFPLWYVQAALGKDLDYSEDYQVGVKYHWPLSQDFRLLIRRPQLLRKFIEFSMNPRARSNIWLRDIAPSVVEAWRLMKGAFRSLLRA